MASVQNRLFVWLVAFLTLQSVGVCPVLAQGQLIIEPSLLFFTNEGPNDFALVNAGSHVVEVDSMHFSSALPYGWVVEVETVDGSTRLLFARGELSGPNTFPTFSLDPDDTTWVRLEAWDPCIACKGALSSATDTLFVVTPGDPEGGEFGVIDFTYYVATEHYPNTEALTVELYPNPARFAVNVNVNGERGMYWIEVFDIGGKLVTAEVGGSQHLLGEHRLLDLSQLASGYYLVRVTDASSTIVKSIVVVQ